MSDNLDLDQTRHFVASDLGSNCLQRLYKQTTLVDKQFKFVLNVYNHLKHAKMKPVQFCTGFIICTFPVIVKAFSAVDLKRFSSYS